MALLDLPPTAGTQADFAARLRSLLPARWFADVAPVLSALLNGLAAAWQDAFALLEIVQAQSRIATASGSFLDLIALDFFANRLARNPGEPDDVLRARISSNLLRVRNTRAAVSGAVQALTGRAPLIVEPARIADTGAYDVPATLAYNTIGAWGSFGTPFTCFVRLARPLGAGVANCGGYGVAGGYGTGALRYTDAAMAASDVADAAIYAAIADAIPVATSAWVAISN